ncbi:hypothetical protein N8I77_008256 [Diaporthe amygdali]|uniref:Uncharacterized protein n=1 Tax=Phomopsis amygdali TaxID=1214568 RepID=A0AAD9SEL0_PHOAM|nr:hypothetical protein N8I77_008256 [Diaporthe amygdali]
MLRQYGFTIDDMSVNCVVCLRVLWGLLRFTQSESEPLAVETLIPFISPAISMWRRSPNYWNGPQSPEAGTNHLFCARDGANGGDDHGRQEESFTPPSSRVILEDHLLDGRFLLKKDNILLIPGVVQHQDRTVWGEDVDVFSHKRFVGGQGGSKGGRRLNPVAFRGFGGGSTLCPGRHFAATEIMAFAALFVLRFDARPASGVRWSIPTVENTNMATSIHQPDHDVEIEVRLLGNERVRWEVKLSESNKPMEVSAEDVAAIKTTV